MIREFFITSEEGSQTIRIETKGPPSLKKGTVIPLAPLGDGLFGQGIITAIEINEEIARIWIRRDCGTS